MDSEELRNLIKQKEGAKLDFKIKLYEIYDAEKDRHWDEFIKDILSLANGNIGTAKETGYLVIGAGDRLKPDGTRDLLDVGEVKFNRKQLLDKVNAACHPPLPDINCEIVSLDGKNILIVTIPPSPYLHELSRYLNTPKKGYSPSIVLIRRQDGEKIYEASEAEKQRLEQEKKTIPVSCIDDGKDRISISIESLVEEVRSHCCQKLEDLHSKIQLFNRQQIDVDKLYVDVYVLEKLTKESYSKIPDLLKDYNPEYDRVGLGKRGKRVPGFDIAANYSRLMILGKPGTGKTTFLRHLAIACCKGEFLADYIPILIELRYINPSEFNLFNYIHQELDLANEEETKQILKQGKVLILLDGLDEVASQSRRDIQEHIYKFSQQKQYYKNRFILTCRTQTTEYTLATFNYIEVADLEPDQFQIFAQNWFTALAETPEEGSEIAEKFLAKLWWHENYPTAELAVTPILLSLTCLIFNDQKDFPAKRSDLYEIGVNLMLTEWDEKRGVTRTVGSKFYRNLSVGEKKKLLSYLAFRKSQQEQYVLFEESEIQEYIAEYLSISIEDSQGVVQEIEAQHGLLIERAHGIWSFSHLTFQEYFAAKWFVENADWQGLVSHVTEKHWWEVFLLVLEILPNPDNFLRLMKKQVDSFMANDEKLQLFLFWIYFKSLQKEMYFIDLGVKDDYYQPVAIRCFYLCLEFIYGLELFSIDEPMELADRFDVSVVDIPFGIPPLDIDRELYWLLEFSNSIWFSPKDSITKNIDNIFRYLKPTSLLKKELEKLKYNLSELPDPDREKEKFEEVWADICPVWTNQLRWIMINYLYIGYDWNFSQEQIELLRQYYDANELLLQCIDINYYVKQEIRDEIEEMLLLPTFVIAYY